MIVADFDFSASLGKPRNQGKRGTCLAFATSDFNRTQHACEELSVEYLCHHAALKMPAWKPGDGLTVKSVVDSLAAPGQPSEMQYPYQEHIPEHPLSVPPTLTPLFTSNFTREKLTMSDIESELRKARAVCLIIAVSPTFRTPIEGVVTYSAEFIPNALHALLAVGVGLHATSKEKYVLIRNSWGEKWGNNGHAWLPEAYLKTHLTNSFAL